MKRLHKFILKSYFGPLIATFLISLFILLMQFLWKYIDDLAGKGLEWYVIAELIIYTAATLVPMALPLAILLSSIMTFGNLGENFELTAIKSAGVSLQSFMSPLIYLTVLISIGAFFYSEYIIPYSNLKYASLIYDVKNQKQGLLIKEGAFYNGIDGYSIKVAKKNHKTGLLQNIMIYDHTDNKNNVKVTVADSGYMKLTADERNMILTLYNGYTYEELPDSKRKRKPKEKQFKHQHQKFEKQKAIFELTGFDFNRTDEDLFRDNYRMLRLRQLNYAEDSLTKEFEDKIHRFKTTLKESNYFKDRKTNSVISRIEKPKSNVVSKVEEPRDNIILKRKKILSQNKTELDTIIEVKQKGIAHDTFILSTKNLDVIKVLEKIGNHNQERAIKQALTYARATQSHITSNKKSYLWKGEKIRRHQIERNRKFSLSFACLVFFFIGAPFGAIIRKGGFGTPVVVSVLFFILYYMISISGEKFVREGVMPAYVGMWLSSFILMPLGIFLTYKATTDSVILNADTYLLFFKKFFAKFFKKTEK